MRILRILVIIAAILIVLGLIFLPSQWDVDVSVKINASSETVFPYINNLKKFGKWAPWQGIDSTMTLSYNNTSKGVGAESEWKSETQGNGRMRIIESIEFSKIKTALWLDGDYDGEPSLHAIFSLSQKEGVSEVHWIINEPVPYWNIFARLMLSVLNPMIEEAYQDGLNDLKALVEKL